MIRELGSNARIEAVVGKLAESHDRNASPALRHAARDALGLGPCEPTQECPFCDPYCAQAGGPPSFGPPPDE